MSDIVSIALRSDKSEKEEEHEGPDDPPVADFIDVKKEMGAAPKPSSVFAGVVPATPMLGRAKAALAAPFMGTAKAPPATPFSASGGPVQSMPFSQAMQMKEEQGVLAKGRSIPRTPTAGIQIPKTPATAAPSKGYSYAERFGGPSMNIPRTPSGPGIPRSLPMMGIPKSPPTSPPFGQSVPGSPQSPPTHWLAPNHGMTGKAGVPRTFAGNPKSLPMEWMPPSSGNIPRTPSQLQVIPRTPAGKAAPMMGLPRTPRPGGDTVPRSPLDEPDFKRQRMVPPEVALAVPRTPQSPILSAVPMTPKPAVHGAAPFTPEVGGAPVPSTPNLSTNAAMSLRVPRTPGGMGTADGDTAPATPADRTGEVPATPIFKAAPTVVGAAHHHQAKSSTEASLLALGAAPSKVVVIAGTIPQTPGSTLGDGSPPYADSSHCPRIGGYGFPESPTAATAGTPTEARHTPTAGGTPTGKSAPTTPTTGILCARGAAPAMMGAHPPWGGSGIPPGSSNMPRTPTNVPKVHAKPPPGYVAPPPGASPSPAPGTMPSTPPPKPAPPFLSVPTTPGGTVRPKVRPPFGSVPTSPKPAVATLSKAGGPPTTSAGSVAANPEAGSEGN